MLKYQHGGDATDETDAAADGEINAAGDDDQGHANGHDGDHGNLIGDVQQVLGLQEMGPPVAGGRDHARRSQRRKIGGEVRDKPPTSGHPGGGDRILEGIFPSPHFGFAWRADGQWPPQGAL